MLPEVSRLGEHLPQATWPALGGPMVSVRLPVWLLSLAPNDLQAAGHQRHVP